MNGRAEAPPGGRGSGGMLRGEGAGGRGDGPVRAARERERLIFDQLRHVFFPNEIKVIRRASDDPARARILRLR